MALGASRLTEGTTPRATLCADEDEQAEVALLATWLDTNESALASVSENLGCGCCTHVFEVTGPQALLDAIPPTLRAVGAWNVRSGGAPGPTLGDLVRRARRRSVD